MAKKRIFPIEIGCHSAKQKFEPKIPKVSIKLKIIENVGEGEKN
jgi:hypothetical protein